MNIAHILLILIFRLGIVMPQKLNSITTQLKWGPWHSKDSNISCVFTHQPCDEDDCLDPDAPQILKTSNCGSWKFVIHYLYSPQCTVKIAFPEGTILNKNLDMITDFLINFFGPGPVDTARLYGYKGIDLDFFSPLRFNDSVLFSGSRDKSLYIHQSPFDLYLNGEFILTPDKCNSETYQALINVNKHTNVLRGFYSFGFWHAKFKHKICKYMFQNYTSDNLQLTGSVFEFEDTSPNGPMLNSEIMELQFSEIRNLNLNTKVIDPDVFENTQYIVFNQVILFSVQPDLFKDRFYKLKQITFEILNMRAFFHDRYGVAWLKNLNYHIKDLDLDNETVFNNSIDFIKQHFVKLKITIDLKIKNPDVLNALELFPYMYYYFTDQDFCLFYDFPVQRLVFLQLDTYENVTCTIAWLYRYVGYYTLISSILETLETFYIYNVSCNFTKLLELCHVNTTSTILFQYDPYTVWYNWGKSLNDVKLVLLDYTKPIVCVISLVSNMLIVICILYNHKRRHEISFQAKNKDQEIVLLEQSLYKYILLNSILNSTYLLFSLIDNLIPCIPVENNNYSYPYPDGCKPKAVFFDASTSILKLMSNFSFLQISINRYILVGKDHPEWIVKTSQISVKRFFFYSLLVSALLSSSSYFEVDFYTISAISYHIGFDYATPNNIGTNVHNKMKGLTLLSVLTIIHDLFSYFLYCLVSLVLDILTVKKLHDALREKEKVKGKGKVDRRKNRESERRSIIMIVTNSLVNFLLRAPELISVVFYNMILSQGGFLIRLFCFMYSDCLAIVNFAKVFYILSLSLSVVFYVKFNSVFRLSFLTMLRSVFKCMNNTPTQPKT